MDDIRIGTLVFGQNALERIPRLIEYGFESFNLMYWQTTGEIDLVEQGKRLREVLDQHQINISCLTICGNPLVGEGDDRDTLASWYRLIDAAEHFDTNLVTGFTGRVPGTIEESIPSYVKVFGEMAKYAADKHVNLAFENCDMNGSWKKGGWNIAHGPSAWELMFNALPAENIGLQWEPAHWLANLMDPIPHLRKWAPKIMHVHGKDATIAWDIIKEYGINGPKPFAWHRTPGFGDSNWTDIITILRQNGYKGSIDIEGFHDPVYKQELEMTGQVRALHYLKECRGGEYIPHF